MLTGSDSAPAKAREAADKNEIGTAKDSATLLVTEYTQEFYDKKYVENDVSMKNVASAGDYIKSKLSSEVTRDGYKIQTVSNSGNEQESQTGIWVDGTKVSEMSLSQITDKLKSYFDSIIDDNITDTDFSSSSGTNKAKVITYEGEYFGNGDYFGGEKYILWIPVGTEYAFEARYTIETDTETGDATLINGFRNLSTGVMEQKSIKFGEIGSNGVTEGNYTLNDSGNSNSSTINTIAQTYFNYIMGEGEYALKMCGDGTHYLDMSSIIPSEDSGSNSNSKIQISKGDTVLATGTISSNGVITWDNN